MKNAVSPRIYTTNFPWLIAMAGAIAATPLWATDMLPLVDLPQHLHLIEVMHRLHDRSTLFPEFFALRGGITPYLGYYYAVHTLAYFCSVPVANKIVLSAYMIALPLSVAYLLRSVHRPRWPALLVVPFAYGDSFAWGFLNYCMSLPLVFFAIGSCLNALEPTATRRTYVALSMTTVAVFFFHIQSLGYLALLLPILIVLGPRDSFFNVRARVHVVVALLPIAALGLFWAKFRLDQQQAITPGAPWQAWGPTFSPENLAFKSFAENRNDLVEVLANHFHDGSDRWPVRWVLTIALCATGLALVRRKSLPDLVSLRLLVMITVAAALYFLLPFDIRGYMYYLNTRYAHLVACLAICLVPAAQKPLRKLLLPLALMTSLWVAQRMGSGFHRFTGEAEFLTRISNHCEDKVRVMGLIFDAGSGVVRHPVFLHSANVVAREHGGVTNFSFALTPHSPLRYRVEPPPTFPSEWRPDAFRYQVEGPYYNVFLVRGPVPHDLSGRPQEVAHVATEGPFSLWRRRTP